MKKHNPHIPILIREATGTEPKIWTRFGVLHWGSGHNGTDAAQDSARSGQNHYQVFPDARRTRTNIINVDLSHPGLSDKEVEERVTNLVKTEL